MDMDSICRSHIILCDMRVGTPGNAINLLYYQVCFENSVDKTWLISQPNPTITSVSNQAVSHSITTITKTYGLYSTTIINIQAVKSFFNNFHDISPKKIIFSNRSKRIKFQQFHTNFLYLTEIFLFIYIYNYNTFAL